MRGGTAVATASLMAPISSANFRPDVFMVITGAVSLCCTQDETARNHNNGTKAVGETQRFITVAIFLPQLIRSRLCSR